MTIRGRGTARWAVLTLVGVLGGIASGMFGVGGGLVVVPLLLLLAGADQRHAVATSLMAVVPTAGAASMMYLARGQVDVPLALLVAAGAPCGAWLGARLLVGLPALATSWAFIAVLVATAVRLTAVDPARGAQLEITPYVGAALIVLGVVTGVTSSLFGVGGGLIVVPVLVMVFGVDDLLAKGTSLLVMIPAALVGAAVHARHGVAARRDGLVLGCVAAVASFGGVALAFLVTPEASANSFAALLSLAAVHLAVRTARAGRLPRTGSS